MIGNLYIVSAPSGAGKTSLVHRLVTDVTNVCLSVSHTTRTKRPTEIEGKDYHFVDQCQFGVMRDQGLFLESASVFDNWYGTSSVWVQTQLTAGLDVVLEIDWQGAQQVRQAMPDCVSVFILPPSMASLRERLSVRGQDSPDIIERRMQEAVEHMSHFAEFDYVLINNEFDQAISDLIAIFQAQRLRVKRLDDNKAQLITHLLKT